MDVDASAVPTKPTATLASTFHDSLSLTAAATTTTTTPAASQGSATHPQAMSMRKSSSSAALLLDENRRKTLLLKAEVQQKARELIEKQIKDQKLLLAKFEQAKSVDEKSLILSLVKKLSESIEKERQMLSSNNMTSNESPFAAAAMHAKPAMSIPPAPHHLKLNNKRLNHTSFLKANAAAAAAALNKTMPSSDTAASVVATSSSPAQSASIASAVKAAAAAHPATPYGYGGVGGGSMSRVSVDHRPRQLRFAGVEGATEKSNILNFVGAQLGCMIESVTDSDTVDTDALADGDAPTSATGEPTISFVISFHSRKDAEVALSRCSMLLSGKATISITWFKAPPAAATAAATAAAQIASSEAAKNEAALATALQQQEQHDQVAALLEGDAAEAAAAAAASAVAVVVAADDIVVESLGDVAEPVALIEETVVENKPPTPKPMMKEAVSESTIKAIISSVSNEDNTSESNDNVDFSKLDDSGGAAMLGGEQRQTEEDIEEDALDAPLSSALNYNEDEVDENSDVFDSLFSTTTKHDWRTRRKRRSVHTTTTIQPLLP